MEALSADFRILKDQKICDADVEGYDMRSIGIMEEKADGVLKLEPQFESNAEMNIGSLEPVLDETFLAIHPSPGARTMDNDPLLNTPLPQAASSLRLGELAPPSFEKLMDS